MHHTTRIFCAIFFKIVFVCADTYTVKIGDEQHVNLVDSRFLSFTIDPKYLFSANSKYSNKECICMASSLTPAYIRIAGPSTALMSYHNFSISIDEGMKPLEPKRSRFQNFFNENLARIDDAIYKRSRDEKKRRQKADVKEEGRFKRNHAALEVSHAEWRRFVQWAKTTGFDLVFAVNNEEKMSSGMWDPNMALNILTVAEKAHVEDIFWQLGYECRNQSIEEYLNDLETLRVITETFPAGKGGRWKVVGGDVTNCLQEDSRSDFKDYVTLSSDMMDAIMLNGNSSTAELDRMPEKDRLKLLKLLSQSTTPLWLTEKPWKEDLTEMSRAADWLTSLGHAARNGFSVHYRELDEVEMFQPTLSFYMALLFKNLVGEKVLHVDMQPEQAIVFAHCTSLRHKAVPGAVTLYGVNMDDEPARFSIKLSKREEGGDIMQFVMGHDKNGNVIVNGKAMYHEGDIKPVVKRVRPYKTLLINLPAKSFGFWVLANTKIEACLSDDKYNETENIDDAVSISEEQEVDLKAKRSVNPQDFEEYTNSEEVSVDFRDEDEISDKNLRERVESINKDLNKVEELFKVKSKDLRNKRESDNGGPHQKLRKFIRNNLKNRNIKSEPEPKPRRVFENILQNTKHNITKLLNVDRFPLLRKIPIFNKNKLTKRQSDNKHKRIVKKYKENTLQENIRNNNAKQNVKTSKHNKNIGKRTISKENLEARGSGQERKLIPKTIDTEKVVEVKNIEENVRSRRDTKDQVDLSTENEIDMNGEDNVKLWKMLRKIHKQFKDLSEETDEYFDDTDAEVDDPQKVIHTKEVKHDKDVDLSDDTTFIKKTIYSLLRVISDLNKNLNRFWNGMRLID